MREILFRGKRKDNGEWVYGYPLIDTADCSLKAEGKCVCPHDGSWAKLAYWADDYHEYETEKVIPKTIGQYTGLTDKNGVKIFEGDIVSGRLFGNKILGEICWIYNIAGFGVRYRSRDDLIAWKDARILKDICHKPNFQFEAGVIGNIHDNPELMKEAGGK